MIRNRFEKGNWRWPRKIKVVGTATETVSGTVTGTVTGTTVG